MPNQLNSEQWADLLSLLSLDGALSLYEEMGVPVQNKTAFQQKLREVILKGRQMYEARPDQIPSLAAMLLDRLGSAAGEPLAKWAQGVFLGYHADQPEWSAWDIVFSQWAYSRQGDLDFLPVEKRETVISSYKQTALTDNIKWKGERLMLSPLSDWDLEMFTRRGYGVSWESSPYSAAESIIRIERLKRFISEIWPSLTITEKELLQQRAQAMLCLLPVWMPGTLPSLDQLLLP